eukprot:12238343-Ditylum_brightwellii.AAC.1
MSTNKKKIEFFAFPFLPCAKCNTRTLGKARANETATIIPSKKKFLDAKFFTLAKLKLPSPPPPPLGGEDTAMEMKEKQHDDDEKKKRRGMTMLLLLSLKGETKMILEDYH